MELNSSSVFKKSVRDDSVVVNADSVADLSHGVNEAQPDRQGSTLTKLYAMLEPDWVGAHGPGREKLLHE